MSEKKSSVRDDINKAVSDKQGEYYLGPLESIAALTGGVVGGMAGGKAIARRMASRSTRKAEEAAMARFKKSGADWPAGKDAKTIERMDNREMYGTIIGGGSGMGGAVYAATRKKSDKKPRK